MCIPYTLHLTKKEQTHGYWQTSYIAFQPLGRKETVSEKRTPPIEAICARVIGNPGHRA
jgi:hypothetical protein